MELLAIIRRVDTNGDACLDFNEFAEYLKCAGHQAVLPERMQEPMRQPGPPKHESPSRSSARPLLRVSDEDELVNCLRE